MVSILQHVRAAVQAIRTTGAWALMAGVMLTAVSSSSGVEASPLVLSAEPATISDQEWALYRNRFVDGSGRVLDVDNGGQSHSEGQGYGMIFAVEANDPATFDRIWRFTKDNLQIRSDSLLAWRWRPETAPHVTDINNATDGDILVAYALLRAAMVWDQREYAYEADRIIGDIGRKLVAEVGGRPVLRPAAFGFDETSGNRGPVVNLSYYIFSAFPLFEIVRPEFPWQEIAAAGFTLTEEARHGRRGLVPDWISVSARGTAIANGFDAKSSYDAVRIPLYMALAGAPGEHFASFDMAWNVHGGGHPIDYMLRTDSVLAPMNDPGYRLISALAACANRGAPIPAQLQTFHPTTYFASSLQLLGLVAVRRNYVECIDTPSVIIATSRSVPAAVAPRPYYDVPRPSPRDPRTTTVVAPQRPTATRAPAPIRAAFHRQSAQSFSDRIMQKSWLPVTR
ncbi:glycosyl hydrolase family 8 [Acuticoccus sp. M5D2P5]|uniref:glycosyl hydrolase family 8 n=1 Tax=Acuticoccus kalidii TaxID=2910977 RepID=UPI001F3B711F|nr:glycosyl hydrolase family 8 [Acuticoccus kalidii]MCF3932196.1 glycosyl hydrolase family 8 [Acuticoccus kalidii]